MSKALHCRKDSHTPCLADNSPTSAQHGQQGVNRRYTLLRTPADSFFPSAQYQALEDALLEYGETQLGCRGMSPAWVACYTDGCRQVRPCST